MGSFLVADPWLLELGALGGSHRRIASILLRAQILTSKRTGHVLDLSSEFPRRKIVYSARYGHVADVVCRCMRCGWQARLTDWVKASEWDVDQRRAVLATKKEHRHPEDWAFVRPCPGEEYARDIFHSTSLPSVEGE